LADSEVVGVVRRYLKLLQAKGLRAERAVLYGSHAKGTAAEYSDIDVLILSTDFGKDRVAEGQFLFRMARLVDSRIEPVPIHPSEYREDPDSPLIHSALNEGVEILSS